MKAVKYKITCFDGVLEWTHGMGKTVDEIFIPGKHLCFNTVKGLNVFKSNGPRSKEENKEIEIPDDICRSLGLLLNAIEGIYKEKEVLLQEITKANLFKEEK